MPLPPALAARLARRGIVERESKPPEEILAENYESSATTEFRSTADLPHVEDQDPDEDLYSAESSQYIGHPGCPNKWNVYHTCQLYCRTRWGLGEEEPEARYLQAHRKAVGQYPPGPQWREKFDPGTGRFFFWSTSDPNRVSWLPPDHPKAKITQPAAKIRELFANRVCKTNDDEDNVDDEGDEDDEDDDDDDDEDEEEEEMDLDSANESDSGGDDDERGRRSRDARPPKGAHPRRGREHLSGSSQDERTPLDPMDPSSYSDAPRGKWSRGLEKARE